MSSYDSIFGTEGPKIVYNYGVSPIAFTVVAATNIFTASSAHNFYNNQIITLATTGTLPTPLAIETNYYVILIDSTTFKLSASRNGSEIDITDTGSGTHTLIMETTVILGKWVPTKFEPENEKEIENESELEADRDIISLGGEFYTYEGFVHLHKYSTGTLIRSKFEEIYQFNRRKVTLYKHKDGNPFRDVDGNVVLWYMNCFPKNLRSLDYRDLLYVKFRSCRGIDFSDNSIIIIQPNEIIMGKGLII